jgi:hypothetical protein
MNPQIEFFATKQILKFYFDNGLTLRAMFLPKRTKVTLFQGKQELRNCECECLTADAFADTLHEYSRMTRREIHRNLKGN